MNKNNADNLILVINPGSTSTKVAVFSGEKSLFEKTIRHSIQLTKMPILEQQEERKSLVTDFIFENGYTPGDFCAIVARGGQIKPVKSGVYHINDRMVSDLKTERGLSHASALGGLIARLISEEYGVPSYIADPVVVDELAPVARVSGFAGIERKSVFHALNSKAVSRKYAKENGKKYEELNLIVAHIGGGVSVSAHKYGRVIDVNDALNGEGAFSPTRTGGLPLVAVVEMCFSGKYSKEEIVGYIQKNGGTLSYLGTSDIKEIEQMILSGDENARLIWDAMIYQISKDIGALSTVLMGKIDRIIFTGGITYSDKFVKELTARVNFLAPITVYQGEDEMNALAVSLLDIISGEVQAIEY